MWVYLINFQNAQSTNDHCFSRNALTLSPSLSTFLSIRELIHLRHRQAKAIPLIGHLLYTPRSAPAASTLQARHPTVQSEMNATVPSVTSNALTSLASFWLLSTSFSKPMILRS